MLIFLSWSFPYPDLAKTGADFARTRAARPSVIRTCAMFRKPVIKTGRNILKDREYVEGSRALQGAGPQEVVGSNKKSVQAAERV